MDLARLGGMVDFPDHGERARRRPGTWASGQGAAAGAAALRAGAEPEAVRAGEDHDAAEGHDDGIRRCQARMTAQKPGCSNSMRSRRGTSPGAGKGRVAKDHASARSARKMAMTSRS